VGPGEEEVSDVGASDEENEADRGEKEESGLARVADLAVVEIEDPQRNLIAELRGHSLESLSEEGLQLGVSLGGGLARVEPGEGGQKEHDGVLLLGGADLHPLEEVERLERGQFKGRRKDTNDADGLAIDFDRRVQQGGVAGEARLPEVIGDESGFGVIGFGKVAPEEGLYAESGKKVVVDLGAAEADRIVGGEVAIGVAEGSGEMGEDGLRFLPRKIVGAEEKLVGLNGGGHAEPDETVGLGVREGTEEDSINDGEDGGGGAEAEGEREDGGRGEERSLRESAGGVAEILEELIEIDRHMDGADGFRDLEPVAEAAAGLFGAGSVIGAEGEVGLEFFFPVVFVVLHQANLISLAMPLAVCSQVCSVAARRFLPEAVSL